LTTTRQTDLGLKAHQSLEWQDHVLEQAFLPASWHRMISSGKVARLLRGSGPPGAVPGIGTATGFASQSCRQPASRSPILSLQTRRAQSLPAMFSSPGASSYQLPPAQADKTHLPELASVGGSNGSLHAQETGHLSWRSFSQSVLSHREFQIPEDGGEEGGLSMKQGTDFCQSCKRSGSFRMRASAISPT
jgi:hypothetical protein